MPTTVPRPLPAAGARAAAGSRCSSTRRAVNELSSRQIRVRPEDPGAAGEWHGARRLREKGLQVGSPHRGPRQADRERAPDALPALGGIPARSERPIPIEPLKGEDHKRHDQGSHARSRRRKGMADRGGPRQRQAGYPDSRGLRLGSSGLRDHRKAPRKGPSQHRGTHHRRGGRP